MRLFFPLILLGFFAGCAHLPPSQIAERPFLFKKDTFAFENQLLWDYQDGERQLNQSSSEKEYVHRCFVMSRSAVQFWKFARFEPKLSRFSKEELVSCIRKISQRDVWKDPLPELEKWVVPGYANLYEFSKTEGELLREHIGKGWPTFFRLKNSLILFPPSKTHQENTCKEIETALEYRHPMILWLCDIPKREINHVVVVYEKSGRTGSDSLYSVYDPNIPDAPQKLTYDPKSQTFSFQKTFYFKGGPVSVRPIYLNMLE
jgi:hypothetical protein